MHDNSGPWEDELDPAWTTFRIDLIERLASLAPGEVLALGTGRDVTLPYVRFGVLESLGVVGEVLGNDGDACRRLSSSEIALLSWIGWWRLPDESEPAVTHWRRIERSTYDEVALMTERTLREAFGVLHPSFLGALSAEDTGVGPSPEPVREEAPIFADGHDDLTRLVASSLKPLLGDDQVDDDDDDGAVRFVSGETVVHVQVVVDAPAVDVFSVLVEDVADPERALAEVNILNRNPCGATYTYRGDRILARRQISARPFVAQQLREAVAHAVASYDELAGDLVGRVGGRRSLAAAEEHEHPVENAKALPPAVPARICLRTLMHLEADQPGSVDARLAAHIFGHNQEALLGQITWLRRDGRVALVPLLRQALRVVVESDARAARSTG